MNLPKYSMVKARGKPWGIGGWALNIVAPLNVLALGIHDDLSSQI
jgi:hypothetical protein